MDETSTTTGPDALHEAPSEAPRRPESDNEWALQLTRVLAELDQGLPGPTVLVQGGIHGNEPAGVHALQRVLEDIERRGLRIHGRLVACVGNLGALRSGKRYQEGDLNRRWLPGVFDRLAAQDEALDDPEDREQRELLALYQRLDEERSGPFVFLDLHTSSADGPPFTCMADTIPNRRVADQIPNPMILGLEECIDGAVMDWFNRRGQVAIAFEGGRHEAKETVDNLEACAWLALAAVGVIARKDVDIGKYRRRLADASRGTPHLIAVLKRHAITPEDGFVMVPGYVNFQPIAKGELLARDVSGEIRAERDGMVLLPLYQGQGNDGFFFARRVPRFWFRMSFWLRRFRLGHLLHWLPGVRRDNGDAHSLIVNPRIARFWVVQVFHLFGFRRERARPDGMLSFSRRRARAESWTVRPRK